MKKRTRIDSPTAAIWLAQGAVQDIIPPSHIPLEDMDWPFWYNVVAEFARAQWTEHQLELAALLSRTLANLEQEQRTLRAEGFVLTKENGTTAENPRSRAVKSLTGDILSLRRSLALRARSGDGRTDINRRELGKKLENSTDDGLIARP